MSEEDPIPVSVSGDPVTMTAAHVDAVQTDGTGGLLARFRGTIIAVQ